MRLVICNPQIHWLGKIVSKVLTRQKSSPKYSYLLDFFVRDPRRPTAFFIDGTRSSMNEIGLRFPRCSKFLALLEIWMWMLMNHLNPFHHKVFFHLKQLNPKEDLLLNFAYTTLDEFARNHDRIVFHEYDGIVLTHLTHYFKNPGKIHRYGQRIKHHYYIAENDLSQNPFFHHFFPDISRVYQLPFVLGDRFQNRKTYSVRKKKCFGIGTFSTPRAKDFIDFFGKGTNLQPMRKEIFLRAEELKSVLDCGMYDFDPMRSLADIKPDDSWKIRWAKKHLPTFVLYKILPSYHNTYLGYDIVEKYNKYQMFVCPEEIVGLPSVSVFEGMACGCVFFGSDDPMYASIGMKSGVHYVAYQRDSVADLKKKLEYYQAHPQELETIARAGQAWVQQFRRSRVSDVFWRDLEHLQQTFVSGQPEFRCSFTSFDQK